jgi:hypothetical protein
MLKFWNGGITVLEIRIFSESLITTYDFLDPIWKFCGFESNTVKFGHQTSYDCDRV